MITLRKAASVLAAAVFVVLVSAGPARADDDVKIGLGFLFPIPVPIPIYQLPHDPSIVTLGLLFPIPIPLPVYDYDYPKQASVEPPPPPPRREMRERYGLLQTKVRPLDAEVYVDGRYYGQAQDFFARNDAVEVDPGVHRVEFWAPGYKNYEAEIEVRPGALVSIEYELRPLGR